LAEPITRFTKFEDLPENLRVDEIANHQGVSRGAIYAAIHAQELTALKIGRLTRVTKAAYGHYLGRNGDV
jgi:excisionase family DNA binding protein